MRGEAPNHINLAGGKTCLVLSGTCTRSKSDLRSLEILFVLNPNSRISPRPIPHTHGPAVCNQVREQGLG